MGRDPLLEGEPLAQWDAAALLKLMWEAWNEVFRRTLGNAERTLVRELQDVRNRWARRQTFSSDDAYRALDSTGRLLTAVSAPESQEAENLKMELLRLRFDEQGRAEQRKTAGPAIESQVGGPLKPWREVSPPHGDVGSGRYQQAEFAADLWQVYLGEGTDEYKKPVDFFRRTYLTESLKRLLVGAVQRLSGTGGDPVVQLQTNFGGGKTHTLLALSARRAPGRGRAARGGRRIGTADGAPGCAGRQQDLAGQAGDEAGRHGRAHALGRAGLAARRKEGLRPSQLRMMSGPRAPETPCASCSTSTARVSCSSTSGWPTRDSSTIRATCRGAASRRSSPLPRP